VLATGIAGVAEIALDATVDRHGAIAATARRLPVHDVRDVTRTEGAIWFATFGRGLWRAPAEGGRPRRVGAVDQGYAMLADGDGVLVAHGGGVHRAAGTRAAPVLTGGLPTGDVTAMVRAFGTIWVGTFEHGLARMRGGASFEPVSTERWNLDRRINDLAVSGRGRTERLWIATDRGLYWHDGRVFARVEDPHGPSWIHATSLHVDARGAVWVTTSRELCSYRNEHWQCWVGDERFPVAQLQAVTTDASGRVWVGSLHGLYRFDEASGRFTRHTVSSGDLPVDWVTALVPWGRGVMAGTYHGGLAIGDGEGFRVVREGQGGLASGWVNPHAIERVGDDAWIGTLERGLMIGRPGAWRHLTTADGLPSDDVTGVLAERDAVWVATRGGLARFSRAR
jgi:ligand-binding sensor domain-containing protein